MKNIVTITQEGIKSLSLKTETGFVHGQVKPHSHYIGKRK